ncbi:hypothetical protein L7F22_047921 [Adiantum nelumboides]|nr:hypothetical protein [Adiantum nelumboides]
MTMQARLKLGRGRGSWRRQRKYSSPGPQAIKRRSGTLAAAPVLQATPQGAGLLLLVEGAEWAETEGGSQEWFKSMIGPRRRSRG